MDPSRSPGVGWAIDVLCLASRDGPTHRRRIALCNTFRFSLPASQRIGVPAARDADMGLACCAAACISDYWRQGDSRRLTSVLFARIWAPVGCGIERICWASNLENSGSISATLRCCFSEKHRLRRKLGAGCLILEPWMGDKTQRAIVASSRFESL